MKVLNPAMDTTALRIAMVLFSGLLVLIGYQVVIGSDPGTCTGTGPTDERIAACSRVIEEHDLNGNVLSAAYQFRARAHRELKELDRAIADFGRAIAVDGTNASALYQRCATLALKDDYQSALRDCEQAFAIKPEDRDIRKLRGLLMLKTGKSKEAIRELDALLKDEPRDASTLLLLALAQLDIGERSSAEIDARRALEIDPENEEAKELLEALGTVPHRR